MNGSVTWLSLKALTQLCRLYKLFIAKHFHTRRPCFFKEPRTCLSLWPTPSSVFHHRKTQPSALSTSVINVIAVTYCRNACCTIFLLLVSPFLYNRRIFAIHRLPPSCPPLESNTKLFILDEQNQKRFIANTLHSFFDMIQTLNCILFPNRNF